MSTTPPTRRAPRQRPGRDRRSAANTEDAPGSLRRLKGLLGRPIRFERRDGHLHMVLVERRRPAPASPPPVAELRTALRSRWLARNNEGGGQAMEQLAFVHDELGRTGWAGVALLSGDLLGHALAQAKLLDGEPRSPAFTAVIEQLRRLHVAADLRDGRVARPAGSGPGGGLEVSEVTHEEFEEMERSWVGTRPSALAVGDRDK